MNAEQPRHKKPDMNINLDRPHRVRTTILFWVALLGAACLLAFMLYRFTQSMWVAFGLAGGMLLYMIIAGAVTSKHLSGNPGDGRLD
jgi:FtsH-binding integral membrane protein